jgi:cell division protein FtsQ
VSTTATMALDPTPATNTRWWMTLLQAIAAMLGLALFAAIVFEVQDARDAGVTELQLEGSFDQVDAEHLRDTIKPWIAPGAVLQMDEIKTRLEALPWISHARVERAWPGIVRVRVWEYTASARWNDALLSTDGKVFRVRDEDVPAGLPRLSGPEGRVNEVRDAFVRIGKALGDTALTPSALSLDDRGDWVATTAGGIELRFGRGELAEQLEFIRGPVSDALAGKLDQASYIDLHYSNGFAVGSRPPQKPVKGGKS